MASGAKGRGFESRTAHSQFSKRYILLNFNRRPKIATMKVMFFPRRACLDLMYDYKYDHIEDMSMNERVTVTLPEEIIRDIDTHERNRSRFVLEAVRRELERRRKEELRRSLRKPHQDSDVIAQAGFDEWVEGLPEGDEDLVDTQAGESVRWIPGKGWIKEE